jgi:hypothetical protein
LRINIDVSVERERSPRESCGRIAPRVVSHSHEASRRRPRRADAGGDRPGRREAQELLDAIAMVKPGGDAM